MIATVVIFFRVSSWIELYRIVSSLIGKLLWAEMR